ncbi:DUF342 domain-containing protein [Desulfonatronovibrio hydrogenovorans]|uniref:DUF342 domain-containing protein n=1 Tax=Desulfonatronovibrio hydrogenovorans TaxID=53245 RepID=UPI00048D7059|nr:FapA family protein [Desulfonatronovibrio hydrogenovorans]
MLRDPGNIELYVTDDGLAVKVKSYAPPGGSKAPLTQKQITGRLKKVGIRIDIDHELINAVVAKAAAGSDITGLTVLKGKVPLKKGTLYFKPRGNPEFPVFKGMVIGSMEKHDQDVPGVDVFAQKVLPENSTRSTQSFKVGSGCVLDKESNQILARGYGQVLNSSLEVKVKPLFRISPDKTRITSIIFHSDFQGESITPERIVQSLTEMKLGSSIDHKSIEAALSKAYQTRAPQIAVVARGKPALDGRDGYFDPSEAVKPPDVNDQDVNVRVNFREQSIFRSIVQGTVLGRLYPPEKGQDGLDVFGNTISAQPGKDSPIQPGKNVEVLDSGDVSALISGLVVLDNSQISVLDFLSINGDVDYNTGNIRLDSGSVEIKGSIKEGFSVKSPEHVLVHKNIEEAQVLAGGNVEVSFGIVMKGSGKIKAGGLVRCKFAENAVIQAGGNIIFSSNLNNCQVSCTGVVSSTGKGIVIGGKISAEDHLELGQIGSDYGVKTDVFAGPRQKNVSKLQDEKTKLIKHHKEIKEILVQQAMQSKTGGLNDQQKQRTKELMETYNTIQNRIKKMDRLILEKSTDSVDPQKHYVLVKNIAYPGTTIHIAGKQLKIHEPIRSARFFFDPSKDAVVWS